MLKNERKITKLIWIINLKEINKAIKAQRFSLNYHYPTVAEIKDIVETKAPRIYEKHRIITISYIIS